MLSGGRWVSMADPGPHCGMQGTEGSPLPALTPEGTGYVFSGPGSGSFLPSAAYQTIRAGDRRNQSAWFHRQARKNVPDPLSCTLNTYPAEGLAQK